MRKIELSISEYQKHEIIKKTFETKRSIERTALKLGVTNRYVYRFTKGYI